MLNYTQRQKPDLIVLTGDYSIVKNEESANGLTQIARRLVRIAPTYAVDGNWDIPDDMDALRRGGVRIVEDWSSIPVEGGGSIALGTASWLEKDSVQLPPTELAPLYSVLLCHMPTKFESAAQAGIDLMLVGHTHGGQVRIPVFGALLPDIRLVGKYQAGMYQLEGTRLYVNRGIGMEGGGAPKVRFCCRPEIAIFDIVGEGN